MDDDDFFHWELMRIMNLKRPAVVIIFNTRDLADIVPILSGMAMYMLMAHQGDKEGKKSFVATPIILVGSAGGVFGGLVMKYF
eukprot:m51a1_g14005 hypothetical protein (83) ;mRNA; r:1073166-1074962